MSRPYNEKLAPSARPVTPVCIPITKSGQAQIVPETYGIPAPEIAALCGVDIATARRWKAGTSRVPVAASKLLAGDLGAFGREWRGWKIQRGKIVSPEGWSYTPGEVLALTLLRAQVASLEAERRANRAMVEQSEPSSELLAVHNRRA